MQTVSHSHQLWGGGGKPKKIKGLFALLAQKSGGSVGRYLKKKKIWVWKKCNTIHVCAFLGMQNLRIKVNLGVERGLYSIWLKKLSGTIIKKILTFYVNIFVKKCKIEHQKKKKQNKKKKGKKKAYLFFPNILGRSKNGKQTSFFILGLSGVT